MCEKLFERRTVKERVFNLRPFETGKFPLRPY